MLECFGRGGVHIGAESGMAHGMLQVNARKFFSRRVGSLINWILGARRATRPSPTGTSRKTVYSSVRTTIGRDTAKRASNAAK